MFEHNPQNSYSVLVYSSPALKEGNYTLWSGDQQLSGLSGGMFGGMPGKMPSEGMEPPEGEMPNGQPPEGMEPPAGEMPGGQTPEGMEPPPKPGGAPGGMPQINGGAGGISTEFRILNGANIFAGISPVQ